MRRRFFLGLPISGTLVAQVPDQHHAHHLDTETYARVLEDPSRDAWQKPHEVVMGLALRPDEVIADIGAGTGYFARRFARHAGTVWAVDIDPKLLEIIGKTKPANLRTVLGKADDPMLAAGSLDTAFLCDVLHHIEGWPLYLAKVKAALKPGGRIVVVDFRPGKLPVGPPPAMKIPEEKLVAELGLIGMKVSRRHEGLPLQYFLEFR